MIKKEADRKVGSTLNRKLARKNAGKRLKNNSKSGSGNKTENRAEMEQKLEMENGDLAENPEIIGVGIGDRIIKETENWAGNMVKNSTEIWI